MSPSNHTRSGAMQSNPEACHMSIGQGLTPYALCGERETSAPWGTHSLKPRPPIRSAVSSAGSGAAPSSPLALRMRSASSSAESCGCFATFRFFGFSPSACPSGEDPQELRLLISPYALIWLDAHIQQKSGNSRLRTPVLPFLVPRKCPLNRSLSNSLKICSDP